MSSLNARVTKQIEMADQLDLYVRSPAEPSDLKKEQLTKFNTLQDQLDACEKLIGQWNPLNKFTNVYTVID